MDEAQLTEKRKPGPPRLPEDERKRRRAQARLKWLAKPGNRNMQRHWDKIYKERRKAHRL